MDQVNEPLECLVRELNEFCQQITEQVPRSLYITIAELGRIQDPRAGLALLTAFKEAPFKLCSDIAAAIGAQGNIDLTRAAIEVVKHRTDNQNMVDFLLKNIDQGLNVSVCLDLWIDYIQDTMPAVAKAAARKLTLCGDAAIEPLLVLASHGEPQYRMYIAYAIAWMNEQTDGVALITALSSPYPEIRAAAAQALGKARSSEGLTVLISALSDSDVRVRHESLKALDHYHDLVVATSTVPLLNDEDAGIRSTAAEVLAFRQYKPALESLINLLGDPKLVVRKAVEKALEQIGVHVQHPQGVVPAEPYRLPIALPRHHGIDSLAGNLPLLIRAARVSMEEHPNHHLSPLQRYTIYQALGQGNTVQRLNIQGWLAVLAAAQVLSIFEQSKPGDMLPRSLLDAAIGVLQNTATKENLDELSEQGYHAAGHTWGYDEDDLPWNADLAGTACYWALLETRGELPLARLFSSSNDEVGMVSTLHTELSEHTSHPSYSSDNLNDEHLSAGGPHDTAGSAAVAWSCTINSPICDSERLMEFWVWWLEQAIPTAHVLAEMP